MALGILNLLFPLIIQLLDIESLITNHLLLCHCKDPSTVFKHTKTGLETQKEYCFVVRAVNELGESVDSNVVTHVAALPSSKMNPPTLKSSTTTSIIISWEVGENGGAL